MSDVTRILVEIDQGNTQLSSELLPLVYDELRHLAARKLNQERPGQTLQATALVHDAYLRLVQSPGTRGWRSRRHFFAAAAEAMRRILVEAARRKGRYKHGGERLKLPLIEVAAPSGPTQIDVLALDEALRKLAEEDPQKARLVTLRFFGGLSMEEAAEHLQISRATASRYWTYAKAWLHHEIFSSENDFA